MRQSIINRYIDDIEKSLAVYSQLHRMQKQDKYNVYEYIGEFYRKGLNKLQEDIECYSKVMTNILLFRWLELERYQADQETINVMSKNGIWTSQQKELASKALDILRSLGAQLNNQDWYSLDSEKLLRYVEMSKISTETIDTTQDIDILGYEDIEANFDILGETDYGYIEEDSSEGVINLDNEESSTITYDGDIQNIQDIQDEADKIRQRQEEESDRIEIPIETQQDDSIKIQFGKYVEQQYLTQLMKTFDELYSSCFSGVTSPDGILTPLGALKFEQLKGEQRKQWHFNHSKESLCEDTQVYRNYMNMFLYAIGVIGGQSRCSNQTSDEEQLKSKIEAIECGKSQLGKAMGFQNTTDESNRFPKLQHIKQQNEKIYYPYMHHAFMTGYYALCNGLKDIQKREGYPQNTVKVTSYKHLSKWIHDKIKDCLLSAIKDQIIEDQEDQNIVYIQTICKKLIDSIKNIIIIQDKQKQYLTFKMCSNNLRYQKNQLEELLNEYLTSTQGTTSGIKAIVKSIENDVATIDLVLNNKEYNQNDLMAYQVLDSIIESGQTPSWNNAILGRDDKGIINYDFTKQNRCAVAVYGASGSGKGLMTQAFISNALIDNCNVFYFDGKPDNGAALAKIAWDRGKEAAVFNGYKGSSNTYPDYLEQYQHGIRDSSLLYKVEDIIPDFKEQPVAPNKVQWPFQQDTDSGRQLRKQLIDLSRTLMAFQFVSDMVEIRANAKDKDIKHTEDFCVFIIDEIQDASDKEKNIRKIMAEYMRDVENTKVMKDVHKETKNGVTIEKKADGKIKDPQNWGKDEGYLFCKKWLNWANQVANLQWSELVTKQLRNSRCTLITIFQSNSWLKLDQDGIGRPGQVEYSRIGHLLKDLKPKVTKIVGQGGMVDTKRDVWGDKERTAYKWASEVQNGKWAIAKDESGLQDDAKIVRPFKVFTTDLGNGVRCELDDRYAGGDACRTSKEDLYNKNGEEKKDPAGLDSYTKYMFNNLREELIQKRTEGLTPEDVLQKGYNYFNDCIRELKGIEQIQEYFYGLPLMIKHIGLNNNKFELNDSLEQGEDVEFIINDLDRVQESRDFLSGLNDQVQYEDDDEDEIVEAGGTIDDSLMDNTDDFIIDDYEEDADLICEDDSILDFDGQYNIENNLDNEEDIIDGLDNTNDYDTDGFDTIIQNYNNLDSFETQTKQEDQLDGIAQILNNNQIQAEERLKAIQHILQAKGFKINPQDCTPIEGQQIPEYTILNTDGTVKFQDSCRNKPHTLGEQTILANNNDIQSIRNTKVETDRSLISRYEAVLNVISNSIDKNTVVKYMVTETTVQVNGRNLFLGNLLSNELTMADIFDVEKTFNRFGNLKELIIDLTVLGQIQNQYCQDIPIKTMFNRCPQLNSIIILGNNGRISTIHREESTKLQDSLIDMIETQQNIDKLDVMSAQLINDARYKVKPVQIKRKNFRTAKRMKNQRFSGYNSSFRNEKAEKTISNNTTNNKQIKKIANNFGNIFSQFKKNK